MYLKSLEIQGFKSFPDKTVLQFGEDITAIVGPNGSGKSNISDAIRWVMGEQSSKSLRGGKMEDVIFGGTQKRNQLGFAQVTLVLDNSGGLFPAMEESEISVTRRYYRSGDSEYYINRQSVRLRDVMELFLDTGLGKEGYSIIGQGKIDEILSAKSHERRDVFEQAAGIARYRNRKEETERKLGRTEDNLVRINDKIAELELQVEPLRAQAEKAKEYLLLRDELRGLEIALWIHHLDTLKQDTRALEATFRDSQAQRDSAKAELEALYEQGQQFGAQMQDMELNAQALRQQVTELESQCAHEEATLAVLQTNIQNHEEHIRMAQESLAQQQSREGELQAHLSQEQQAQSTLDEQVIQEKTALDGLMMQAQGLASQAGGNQAELTAWQGKEAMAVAAAADGRAAWTGAQAEINQLNERRVAFVSEQETLTKSIEDARHQAKACRRAVEDAREEETAAHNIIAGHALRMGQREQRAKTAADVKLNCTMEVRAMESRIHLLSEMEREFEGFSKAVRLVMQGQLKGIHGPVGTLMSTSPEYSLAIEIALGGALQNIVVGREEDAKGAIAYLKRRDGGRATFLPMSAIRGDTLRQNLSQESGYVGIGSQLVSFDAKYANIFQNLLGKTVVVEDMDDAIAMARKYQNGFRIVTLDGQIINRGGSMTGGSTSRSAGILSRGAELDTLRMSLGGLQDKLAKATEEEETARRELEASTYQMETAQGQLRIAQDELLRLEGQQSHFQATLTDLTQQQQRLEVQQAALDGQLKQASVQMEQAAQTMATQEAVAEEARGHIQAAMAGQTQLQASSATLAEDIANRKAKLAALEAQSQAKVSVVADLQSRLRALSADLGSYEERATQAQERIAQAQGEMQQCQGLMDAHHGEIATLQQGLQTIQTDKMALEAQRTTQSKSEQTQNALLLDLERTLSKMEQKIATAAMEEKQILDRLWEHYELTQTEARAQAVDLESASKAQRRVSELKRGISSLGNPNIGAIEEFERVNTRYTYLTEQRDDVAQAKGDLLDIIGSITGEMEEIFSRQFNLLAEAFQTTFVELFGGGQAAISLEDPKDILNCGIEIKAQPPGKTLKTISLLSGGEKAFVAIALYFAILKVHPTPFCVMDEIEAALDEANVVRYARYMRNLADKTQFIVITHRRGTMEEADVLYGVTMQEQGVSKMLTIHMNDLAKELGIS
ncbi:chromosome segregation protein SMC [Bengtsoniella intestinalis]|uniref:chromosome segregation protein SMC n=1 Tax=Bengtsoniella intestinalis TaxID=3073143 RepID=UPI00391F157F